MTTLKRVQSLLAIVLFTGISAYAISPENEPENATESKYSSIDKTTTTSIQFKEKTIELGTINQGTPVDIAFEFTNDGDEPLIIDRVKPSCGCTVAEFPREPISPNETGIIKATYNAKAKGKFTKTIRVYSNADTEGTVVRFSGVVE